MTDNGREFRLRLADRQESNRVVTPTDVLEFALEEIREGRLNPTKLLIGYFCPDVDEDGNTVDPNMGGTYRQLSSNLDRAEQLVMLTWLKENLMERWRA